MRKSRVRPPPILNTVQVGRQAHNPRWEGELFVGSVGCLLNLCERLLPTGTALRTTVQDGNDTPIIVGEQLCITEIKKALSELTLFFENQ